MLMSAHNSRKETKTLNPLRGAFALITIRISAVSKFRDFPTPRSLPCLAAPSGLFDHLAKTTSFLLHLRSVHSKKLPTLPRLPDPQIFLRHQTAIRDVIFCNDHPILDVCISHGNFHSQGSTPFAGFPLRPALVVGTGTLGLSACGHPREGRPLDPVHPIH